MLSREALEKILLVASKELVDMCRDFKALIPAVLLAFLLGPLVSCLAPQLIVSQVKEAALNVTSVAFQGDGGALFTKLSSNKGLKVVNLNLPPGDKQAWLSALEKGKVDVILSAPPNFAQKLSEYLNSKSTKDDQCPNVEVLYTGRIPSSSYAGMRMLSVLTATREELLKEKLVLHKVVVNAPPIVRVKVLSPPDDSQIASPFIARTLAALLVFVAFLGAIYPALDLLTGERERGTLESIVITPISRRRLFAGKVLAVTAISYLLVLCTLLGFYVAQFYQPPLLQILPFPLHARLPLSCALISAVLMLPLCLTLAVTLLSLAGLARTVQQAQGYFTALMFVAMMPLGIGVSGDIHLSLPLAVVPFLGCLIMMNDILEARWHAFLMPLTCLISLAYAWLLTMSAAPTMEREDLMFGVEESPERRWSSGRFGRELFLLCSSIFLLMFYLSQSMVVTHHVWGLILTQVFVVFAPGFFLVYFWLKLPLKSVFALSKPRGGFLTCLSALLTAPLTFTVAVLLASAQAQFLPNTKALEKIMEQVLGLSSEPLWLLIIAIALAPAIFEELLFRGVIYSLLSKRLPSVKLIVAVGTLFGLFHLSVMRFLPTASLGCLITFMRLRSASILPCMFLHAGHNGLAVLLTRLHISEPSAELIFAAALVGSLGFLSFLYLTKPVSKG